MNPAFWLLTGALLGWLVGLQMQRSNPRETMECLLAGAFGALAGALVGAAASTASFDLSGIGGQQFGLLSLGHSFLGAAVVLTALRVFRSPAPIGRRTGERVD